MFCTPILFRLPPPEPRNPRGNHEQHFWFSHYTSLSFLVLAQFGVHEAPSEGDLARLWLNLI
jgi:hypothetical protein